MKPTDSPFSSLRWALQFCEDKRARDAGFDALNEIENTVETIAGAQQDTLKWLEHEGIVFDGPPLGNDPKNWQHVAFSIYTDLCEVDSWARSILGENE